MCDKDPFGNKLEVEADLQHQARPQSHPPWAQPHPLLPPHLQTVHLGKQIQNAFVQLLAVCICSFADRLLRLQNPGDARGPSYADNSCCIQLA